MSYVLVKLNKLIQVKIENYHYTISGACCKSKLHLQS